MLKTTKNKIPFSLILSVMFHFGIIISFRDEILVQNPLIKIAQNEATKKLSSEAAVVQLISKDQLQQIKKNLKLQNQIVASENRGEEIAPVNSRFYGEKNNTTERQTIAKVVDSFKKAGLGDKTAKADGNDFENIAQEKREQPKKVAKSANKKIQSLSDLGGFGLERAKAELDLIAEVEADKIEKMKKQKRQGLENGDAGLSGFAANNDHVEEIALGDMTNMNTHEYKYYGFYQRIRSQLEQHWGKTIKEEANKIYRSGRRMPASDSLITSVAVILDDKGQIVQIKIEGSSGVRELDQAAIESFNKAGPFPNPPKGLLVDGRATIQWGFVIKS